jgi:sec-independent protein translocase protein TatB
MFDLSFSEMLVIAVVAIVVIGPKELPGALATLGRWMGQARAVARNFRSGFDAMVREAEMKELEKQWAEQNARIMAEHPPEDFKEESAAQPAASASEQTDDISSEAVTEPEPAAQTAVVQPGLPLDMTQRPVEKAQR